MRASGVSPGALFTARQPCTPHRRGRGSERPRTRDDRDRVAARAYGEPCGAAPRTSPGRSVPRADVANAARGASCASVRTAERAPARGGENTCSDAVYEIPPRPSFLGAVVRRLESGEEARHRAQGASGQRPDSGGSREDMAARGGLASPWAARSHGRARPSLTPTAAACDRSTEAATVGITTRRRPRNANVSRRRKLALAPCPC